MLRGWMSFLAIRVGTQYQWSARLNLGAKFEYIDAGKINDQQKLKGDFRRNEMFFVGLNANQKF
jgi:hypothetical protein